MWVGTVLLTPNFLHKVCVSAFLSFLVSILVISSVKVPGTLTLLAQVVFIFQRVLSAPLFGSCSKRKSCSAWPPHNSAESLFPLQCRDDGHWVLSVLSRFLLPCTDNGHWVLSVLSRFLLQCSDDGHWVLSVLSRFLLLGGDDGHLGTMA